METINGEFGNKTFTPDMIKGFEDVQRDHSTVTKGF